MDVGRCQGTLQLSWTSICICEYHFLWKSLNLKDAERCKDGKSQLAPSRFASADEWRNKMERRHGTLLGSKKEWSPATCDWRDEP